MTFLPVLPSTDLPPPPPLLTINSPSSTPAAAAAAPMGTLSHVCSRVPHGVHVGHVAGRVEATRVSANVTGGEIGVDSASSAVERLVQVPKQVQEDAQVHGSGPGSRAKQQQ